MSIMKFIIIMTIIFLIGFFIVSLVCYILTRDACKDETDGFTICFTCNTSIVEDTETPFVFCKKCTLVNKMQEDKKDKIYQEKCVKLSAKRDKDFLIARDYFKQQEKQIVTPN